MNLILLFMAILLSIAVVGSKYKETPEDWFGARMLGYGFLGAMFVMLRLATGFFWLPVGFLLAQLLLLRRVPNRRAKRYASVVGLVGLFLTALLFGLGPTT